MNNSTINRDSLRAMWAATPRKKLLAELDAIYDDTVAAERAHDALREENRMLNEVLKKAARDADEGKKDLETARVHLNDMKQRLTAAELENARMRGYVARVQEDDVVREELLMTGETDGQQQLVPKRKHTAFDAPSHYSDGKLRRGGSVDDMLHFSHESDRKPRHWVTY